MKTALILTLLVFSAFGLKPAAARNNSSGALVNFIYNFPKMVEGGKGGLCVYGYDQIAVSIRDNYQDVKFFGNEKDLNNKTLKAHKCGATYIAKNRYSADVFNKISGVVTIGTEDNFVDKGGMVLIQMGRRSFDLSINRETLTESGVRLDPLIESFIVN
ncbi:MAG: hypothetical protein ACJAW3_001105 [Lentimonas sp.]|jgi:hypothetical protein